MDHYQNQMTPQRNILVVSRLFFPRMGGIEEYAYNRCLKDPKQIKVLAAGYPGDRTFDPRQPFPIYRWWMPQWLLIGFVGSLLKQIFSMFWSLVLPIWIYWRDRYTSLEWCHGYDFPSLLLLTYILPVRFTIYLHGNDVLCPLRNSRLRWLFTYTLNRCDLVVCNSSFTKQYLLANCPVTTPIEIVNPQVRPAKFGLDATTNLRELKIQVRQAWKIPTSAVTIITVGRLVKRKGFDRVIRCLPKLVTAGIDVHYLVCGKGKMDGELKDLAHQLEIAERVHFTGFVTDDELAGYYAAGDIFAMPTFLEPNEQSIEGFGIVYLEAGYFGMPVIASKVGGVSDAVKQDLNGILIAPDSDAELMTGLQRLCQDVSMRQRLGAQGQKIAIASSIQNEVEANV